MTKNETTVSRTRTFKSGNSQAVRLPRGFTYGSDVELTIIRSGDVITLYPTKGAVRDLVARLAKLPAVGIIEERDTEDLPERLGL